MRSRAWPRGSVDAPARAGADRAGRAGAARAGARSPAASARPLIAAQAAGQMRRPAAEDRRGRRCRRQSPGRPRDPRERPPKREPRSARHAERRVGRDRVVADGDDEVGAAQRRRSGRPRTRARVRRSVISSVAAVGRCRPARWRADARADPSARRPARRVLPAPAPAVLDRRQQSRSDDVQLACH